MRKEWVNDVGAVLESRPKDGEKKKSFYIKINKDITLKAGDIITMKSKADEIDKQAASGKITEERASELKEKLKFIKYELSLAPEKQS